MEARANVFLKTLEMRFVGRTLQECGFAEKLDANKGQPFLKGWPEKVKSHHLARVNESGGNRSTGPKEVFPFAAALSAT